MIKLFILIMYSAVSFASQINITNVNLNCNGEPKCQKVLNTKHLKGIYSSGSHLEQVLSNAAGVSGLNKLSFKVSGNTLNINAAFSKKIKSIELKYRGLDPDLEFNLPISVGDYFEVRNADLAVESIVNRIRESGYWNAQADYKFNKGQLVFQIIPGRAVVIKDVLIKSSSSFITDFLNRIFSSYKNTRFNKQNIREEINSSTRLLEQYGYYLADLSFEEKLVDANVIIHIDVKGVDLYVLNPQESVTIIEQKAIFKNLILSQRRAPSVDSLGSNLKTVLEHKGYLNAEVHCKSKRYKNISEDSVNHYSCEIQKNQRVRIESIEFQGISLSRSKKLETLFYENATSAISGGFLDKRYVYSYVDFIKKYFYERGYVNVLITKPLVKIRNKSATINYKIREGLIANIDKVKILGVSPQIKFKLLSKLKLKKADFFNPLIFEQKLESIQSYLDSIGYIDARISNLNSPTLIRYKNSNTQVDIKIEIDGFNRFRMGRLFILGKKDTKNKLIKREFGINEGELLSSDKLSKARSRLLSLGIFSKVNLKKIYTSSSNVDISLLVEEKDFGTIELAPGVRSDLGARLGFDLSYNNLGGMNKRASLKGSVNQRFDLNTLDEVRRVESNSLVEYDLALNYFENHILDSDFNFKTSVSTQRRRFFSFDADIDSINYTLSRQFSQVFSASVTQQLEVISQFNASSELYEGNFQIGSITPGVRFDLRDDSIIPRKGAWFDLSCEFANPSFYSQDNDELTINYYKFVSRNKFYIPFKNGVFAVSMAMGIQENVADDSSQSSYIPNIKVFRLSGNDIVRGFEDDEINKIPGGQDISATQVNDKAYMGVVKLEPRFFLSDSTMLGIFYDAGRVSVDPIDISNFRSSVGLSFKYLTPVGSINFDYGIKLLRKKLSSGKFESPGRLHVSIGFF